MAGPFAPPPASPDDPAPAAASASIAAAAAGIPDTSIDQARVLLRSIPVGLAGSVVPAGVVAWLLHRHVGLGVLLVWLALLVVAHAGRVAVWLAGRNEVRAGRNGRKWLQWLRLSVLGLGLAWAWLPVTMVPAQPFFELLIAAVVLAVCGAGVAQQSSDAASALLLMLPPAATMSLRLLVSEDATLRIFGGLTFIYFAYLTIATYRIQSSFVELSRLHALASRQSLHDALTGLPNRLALHQRLEDALARAQRSGMQVAVGYIDLDDFKQVNDRLGHEAGDTLLREAARRWGERLRTTELIARLGGDEFAIVIENIDPQRATIELGAVFERIDTATAEPVQVASTEHVRIRMSMGVARYPVDAADSDALLRQADAAMYQIKQRKATRSSWWQLGPRASYGDAQPPAGAEPGDEALAAAALRRQP